MSVGLLPSPKSRGLPSQSFFSPSSTIWKGKNCFLDPKKSKSSKWLGGHTPQIKTQKDGVSPSLLIWLISFFFPCFSASLPCFYRVCSLRLGRSWSRWKRISFSLYILWMKTNGTKTWVYAAICQLLLWPPFVLEQNTLTLDSYLMQLPLQTMQLHSIEKSQHFSLWMKFSVNTDSNISSQVIDLHWDGT